MKKLFCYLLILVMALTVLNVAGAADEDFEIENGVLKKYKGAGGAVTIPDGVTEIAEWAFECAEITSVRFPNSLKKLDNWCFFQCEELKDVTIPASVTSIGTQAFAYNWVLSAIKVASGSSSFTAVDGVVYSKDKKTLVCYPAGKNVGGSYSIPNGTTSIEGAAFSGAKLKTVKLPASMEWVGGALSGYDFEEIAVDSGNTTYKSVKGILYRGDTLIAFPAIKPVEKLGPSDFPSNLKKIDDYAFEDQNGIKTVVFPEGVELIGFMCFAWGESIENVTIPSSIKGIEQDAFKGCNTLKKVTILSKDTEIGSGMLKDCPNVTLYGYKGSSAEAYAAEEGIRFVALDEQEEEGATLSDVQFAKAKATVNQKVTITAVTNTAATKLTMYSGSKAVKSWTKGYTDSGETRTWKVSYAFSGAGKRTVDFKAADAKGGLSEAKSATITITKAPTLASVKFAKEKATVNQKVTITAVTNTTAAKLTMYSGSKAVKSWTSGYTDKDGKRTWKVSYAFAGAGERTVDFKAADANGVLTEAKSATITITKAPSLSSVKFAKAKATVNQKVTIAAVTSTNATKLTMYSGSKAIKSWTSGYTDKEGKRTWKVSYAFSGAGERTMDFKAADANGALTAAKSATITITKAPALSSVKFSKDQAKVNEEITIIAVTNTTTSKLTMYAGTKAVKSWTSGYTDKDGKRTWKVKYAFSGKGERTLDFKGSDANGVSTAAKTATIVITK